MSLQNDRTGRPLTQRVGRRLGPLLSSKKPISISEAHFGQRRSFLGSSKVARLRRAATALCPALSFTKHPYGHLSRASCSKLTGGSGYYRAPAQVGAHRVYASLTGPVADRTPHSFPSDTRRETASPSSAPRAPARRVLRMCARGRDGRPCAPTMCAGQGEKACATAMSSPPS